jgi:hypothetical protein
VKKEQKQVYQTPKVSQLEVDFYWDLYRRGQMTTEQVLQKIKELYK